MLIAGMSYESWGMFFAALIALMLWSLSAYRKASARSDNRESSRDQLAHMRDQREIRDSMDELLVRLEEFSRDINGQVDTKSARLEQLIHDADLRLAELKAANAAINPISSDTEVVSSLKRVRRRLRRGPQPDDAPPGDSTPDTSPPSRAEKNTAAPATNAAPPNTPQSTLKSTTQPARTERPQRRPAAGHAAGHAEKLKPVPASPSKTPKPSRPNSAEKPDPKPIPEPIPWPKLVDPAAKNEPAPSRPSPKSAPVPATPDARFQNVYDLADRGQSSGDIAEAVKLTLGEVELILNLRNVG